MRAKKFVSYLLMLTWAGYTYVVLELLFRQKSDITMLFCASICTMPMIFLNNVFTYKMSILIQSAICALLSTFVELIFGLIFNQDYHIWDYSSMMFNYKGQICLGFFFIWMGLSVPVIMFMDWLEYNIFYTTDETPYYMLFGKVIYRMGVRKDGDC